VLKISDINIEKLRSSRLQKELPEFFKLKRFVENDNYWHNNDSVFDHTLRVLEELEKLLKTTNNKINFYLNQKVDNYTRKDLLFLGALFHDIGKSDSFVKSGDFTSCLKHEELGSKKVKPILDRFDLSDREKNIVIKIIKYHGKLSDIARPGSDSLEEEYEKFKSEYSSIFVELILLTMADTLGSQLKNNRPEEFNFRINFYKKIIKDF